MRSWLITSLTILCLCAGKVYGQSKVFTPPPNTDLNSLMSNMAAIEAQSTSLAAGAGKNSSTPAVNVASGASAAPGALAPKNAVPVLAPANGAPKNAAAGTAAPTYKNAAAPNGAPQNKSPINISNNANAANGNHAATRDNMVASPSSSQAPGFPPAINNSVRNNNSDNNHFTSSSQNPSPVNTAPVNTHVVPPASESVAPLGVATSAPKISGGRAFYSRVEDKESKAFEGDASENLKQKLKHDLDVYCLDYCTILSVTSEAVEVFDANNTDLGFEEAAPNHLRRFRINEAEAEVLVDSRFGTENIDHLKQLFERLIPTYKAPLRLVWSKVVFPESAQTQKSEAEVRNEFAARVRHQIERIINDFCPTECKLNSLDIKTARASMDEAERGSVERFLFARDGRGAIFVKGVDLNLSVNSEIDPARKARIASLIKDYLMAFGNIGLDLNLIPFPKSATEIQKDLDDARRDPYGVEKVGALLKLFKENLVGKEVYKETNTTQNATNTSASTASDSKSSTDTNTEIHQKSATTNTRSEAEKSSRLEANSLNMMEKGGGEGSLFTLVLIGIAILLLIILVFMWIRSNLYGPSMKALVKDLNRNGEFPPSPVASQEPVESSAKLLRKKLDSDSLKDELLENFLTSPKAAREMFAKILREDGVESVAKYVAIFGEIIIYELLKDLQYKAELDTLAEYVDKNTTELDENEVVLALKQLKMRFVAARMRVLNNKVSDAFDFLKTWTAKQIFELCHNESAQVQSILLTQLNPLVRQEIFGYYHDEEKNLILQELSHIDLVPKNVIVGTAEALKRKVQQNPKYNSEVLAGIRVLLDLVATTTFEEQRNLINDLDTRNPDAAAQLRNYLVTPETLMFMKESVLTDLCLDLDLEVLTKFLAGTEKHVRNAILSRVPREISLNWREGIQTNSAISPFEYKRYEAMVMEKIRTLAKNGIINLSSINEKAYPNALSMENTNARETVSRNAA